MNHRELLRKCIAYGLALLGLYLIQTVFLSRLRLFGVTMDLLPFAVAAVAVLEGPAGGAFSGLLLGLLLDASSGRLEGYYAVLYMVSGLLAGYYIFKFYRPVIFTMLLWGAAMSVFTGVLRLTIFFLLFNQAGIEQLWQTVLPSSLLSIPLALVICLILKKINRILTEEVL